MSDEVGSSMADSRDRQIKNQAETIRNQWDKVVRLQEERRQSVRISELSGALETLLIPKDAKDPQAAVIEWAQRLERDLQTLQLWKGEFVTEMCLLIPEGYAHRDEPVSQTILRWAKRMSEDLKTARTQLDALIFKVDMAGKLSAEIRMGIFPRE